MAAKKPVTPAVEPFTIVIVEWEDATGNPCQQNVSPDDVMSSYQPTIRRTVGYLMGNDDRVVAVATDDDRQSISTQAAGGINYIPKGMVRAITVVAKTRIKFAK